MFRSPRPAHPLVLLLAPMLLITLAAPAAADDAGDGVIVVQEGDQRATVTIGGERLRIVHQEDGRSEVAELDLTELGRSIDTAVASALAQLEARDLSVELAEGRLTVAEGDQVCQVDLGAMLADLDLDGLLADLDRELADGVRVHVQHEQAREADLRAELDRLSAEIDRLRDDLQRLR